MAKRVLVTNDDGIDADGIRVLVPALVEAGFEPLVVAPNADYSGAGTSLLGHGGPTFDITYEQRVLPEAPDVEAYALAAPPARCVLLAMRDAFGPKPDLVASGINYGLNTGPAVRHSGTVSAALTASGFGIPALALSAEFTFAEPEKPLRYDTAAAIGVEILALLEATDPLVLNLNVPCCDVSELAGIRSAPLASLSQFRSAVETKTDTTIKMTWEISDEVVAADTDTGLIQAGYASLTSLVGTSSRDCSGLIAKLAGAAA